MDSDEDPPHLAALGGRDSGGRRRQKGSQTGGVVAARALAA